MITAGIDVSAKELVVVVQTKPHAGANKPKTFENNAQGHQTLIHALKKRKVERVCIEATGVYHLDLAVAYLGACRT
jgi:transposase